MTYHYRFDPCLYARLDATARHRWHPRPRVFKRQARTDTSSHLFMTTPISYDVIAPDVRVLGVKDANDPALAAFLQWRNHPKQALHELTMRTHTPAPIVNTLKSGPDHQPIYRSTVTWAYGNLATQGTGHSKKEAELAAYKDLCLLLERCSGIHSPHERTSPPPPLPICIAPPRSPIAPITSSLPSLLQAIAHVEQNKNERICLCQTCMFHLNQMHSSHQIMELINVHLSNHP